LQIKNQQKVLRNYHSLKAELYFVNVKLTLNLELSNIHLLTYGDT